jgi:ABC-type tungstate transport system permease subunit
MRPYGSDFYADKYPALADVSTKAYLVADTSIDWASYESIKPYTPSLKLGTTMTLTDSGTNVMIQDGETLSNTINGIDTATGRAVKVKLGESQKGFMKKTKLFFVEEHLIINGKDVIKWSQPIDVEFSFKAIRRFF